MAPSWSAARATVASPDLYLAGSTNVLTFVATPFLSQDINSPLTLPGQRGYALINYHCEGQVSRGTYRANDQAIEMLLQPSQNLPDLRSCRASHGP